MSELKLKREGEKPAEEPAKKELKASEKPEWQTPKIEDVSDQVMAQPYIRFT